ncbi:Hypothetical predicted protein [Scomber scombrus]|uniref:Secreted protein n=1 Tax=Scomber scombrus TaxID=13677 RepID=A0AAV1MXU7_SCOSC
MTHTPTDTNTQINHVCRMSAALLLCAAGGSHSARNAGRDFVLSPPLQTLVRLSVTPLNASNFWGTRFLLKPRLGEEAPLIKPSHQAIHLSVCLTDTGAEK